MRRLCGKGNPYTLIIQSHWLFSWWQNTIVTNNYYTAIITNYSCISYKLNNSVCIQKDGIVYMHTACPETSFGIWKRSILFYCVCKKNRMLCLTFCMVYTVHGTSGNSTLLVARRGGLLTGALKKFIPIRNI